MFISRKFYQATTSGILAHVLQPWTLKFLIAAFGIFAISIMVLGPYERKSRTVIGELLNLAILSGEASQVDLPSVTESGSHLF